MRLLNTTIALVPALRLLLWSSQLSRVVEAFSVVPPSSHNARRSFSLEASTAESSSSSTSSVDDDVVPTSRFVVQNRFRVRDGREAAFEKRWADRESRLGTLPGFRFFCMLRRLDRGGGGGENDDENNYVSCTVWETYADFEAWRKGDAFKEAHGGGTVQGVVSMLAATAMNTKGKPKPAYWRGLLPESLPGRPPADGEGWKRVEADGQSTLPTDCFVAMNRFSVRSGSERAFEKRFADRESSLKDQEGFRGFLLLRRDGGKQPGDGKEPDDGYTHSTFSVWDSKANFDAWMSESKKKKPETTKTTTGEGSDAASSKPKGPPSIYDRPPIPSFYEGILALESAPGV